MGLGAYITNNPDAHGLGHYEAALVDLAGLSGNFAEAFRTQLTALREARNDKAHQGTAARRAGSVAIAVSIVLEDALMSKLRHARDFMVTGPTCAELWQTLRMLRAEMLTNQFSHLPFFVNRSVSASIRKSGKRALATGWYFLSDYGLAGYLSGTQRSERLHDTLSDSLIHGLPCDAAETVTGEAPVDGLFKLSQHVPRLVVERGHLLGIVTAFDTL